MLDFPTSHKAHFSEFSSGVRAFQTGQARPDSMCGDLGYTFAEGCSGPERVDVDLSNPFEIYRAVMIHWVVPVDGGHHKGPVAAVVDADVAELTRDAMNHHGSLVDTEELVEGGSALRSDGYWAHGF